MLWEEAGALVKANILKKGAAELSSLLTIIASSPYQKPIKTEMGGA